MNRRWAGLHLAIACCGLVGAVAWMHTLKPAPTPVPARPQRTTWQGPKHAPKAAGMSDVASSPATFTVGPVSPLTQAVTFAIPSGTYTAAEWIEDLTTGTGATGTITTGTHAANFPGRPGPGSYTDVSVSATADQLTDINTAAGGTLNATYSTVMGSTLNVSRLIVRLTGSGPTPITVSQSSPVRIAVIPQMGSIICDITDVVVMQIAPVRLGWRPVQGTPLAVHTVAQGAPVRLGMRVKPGSLTVGSGAGGSVVQAQSRPVRMGMTVQAVVPRIQATGNLKFNQCPDAVGAVWRDAIDVASSDSLWAAGCCLGWGYGALYTRTDDDKHQHIYWRASANPDDWSAATETDTTQQGPVWGLACNAVGVLCALVGATTLVSRDQGATWAAGGTVGIGGGHDATIEALGEWFYVVEQTDTGPRHWVSIDGGATWL